jgi:hypothetical protein
MNKSIFYYFDENNIDFQNRINKETKQIIGDVRRLALKHNVEIDLLMPEKTGNENEFYNYIINVLNKCG